jgi:alkanesulfonate monooxygenase SsuD/methylene tetrahydromethanopterin reductase-like flavin-dependent oxidoreductase (luciferase family)
MEKPEVKLSLFMMPLHTMNRPYPATLQEDIEAFMLAEELGFDEGWIGEHYSSSIEQVSSAMMFLSHISAKTKRMKLGTGVVPLPIYHPAQLAAHAALLDHLTGGRLILGVGTGGLGSDFELFGFEDADRSAMMLESLAMMQKIWGSDPPYELAGKYWNISLKNMLWPDLGVGPMPKPLQTPHPALAISVSSPNSGSIRTAARLGLMPISANFVASWVVKTHWETYADELAKMGQMPDGANWRVARSIFVADTNAEAEAFIRTPGGAHDWYYDYMFQVYERMGSAALLAPWPGMNPTEITPQLVRDQFVIYGSVETVAAKILALREEVGPFGTLMMTAHDWTEKAEMRKSMQLLARDVMPRVRAALQESIRMPEAVAG